MERSTKIKSVFATLAVFGLLMTGCAAEPGDTEDTSNGDSTDSSSQTETPAEDTSGGASTGDGEYAFGTDRDDMATAIESAFSSKNGKARWDGDTIILSLDEEGGKGISECLILDQLLNEDDKIMIEYTDITIDCAEALP